MATTLPSEITHRLAKKGIGFFASPERMKLPQPFPYQGSKRNLASLILPYIPKDCETFWEPFSGSAAMTIAVATEKLAKRFVINDINGPLADLWRRIIQDPSGLASDYERLWKEQGEQRIEFYNAVRARFNGEHREEDFLFLLARCVKAAIRYNSKGEFNQSPDPRRSGMLPARMRGNLLAASALLRGRTTVRSADYAVLCRDARPQDVIYMDPPYQGVSKEKDARYSSSLAFSHFVEALHEMNQRELSYIVSYDGRTGDKVHGEPLPKRLGLTLIELEAGRSSQATLLGRDEITVESLYISAPLMARLEGVPAIEAVSPLLL